MVLPRKYDLPLFCIVFAVLLCITGINLKTPERVEADEIRYIKYAVSMHKHDVFGLFDSRDTSEPPDYGRANVPLYPSLIYVVMQIDSAFAESMVCLVENKDNSDCLKPFQLFYAVQLLLAFFVLLFVYLIAGNLSGSRFIPWAAALFIYGSGILSDSASVFMTEILALPLFCALLYGVLRFYKTRALGWMLSIGAILGVMTLVRPSYLYLFYGFFAFFSVYALLHLNKRNFLILLSLIVTFIAVISPWSLRNKAHFDSYALTHDDYAEIILVERTNYNQMSWPEVGVAMIYWLPDFGDSLAEDIFPDHLHNRLGWHDGSYYGLRSGSRIEKLTEELGDRRAITGHIIKNDILTVKHMAVSVPLALRGFWVGKYFGLIGFIAFAALLFQTIRQKDYRLLIISLPVIYMVAFHAGLSVSIPRYNLVLIALYGFSVAYYLEKYGSKLVTKIRNK